MLSEYQLELLPERICERLSKINTDCIISIAEVLKKIGELRPTDVHQLQQMYNYGADIDQIIQALSAASEKNITEIEEVFEIVAKANYDYSTPFYEAAKGEAAVPYEKNTRLKRYVNSVARQTVKEYKNLTQHTAFAVFEKDGKSIAPLFAENKNKVATSISETYTKIIDLAVQKVQTGTSSYQQEMRNVIRALSQSGIKSVDYASGDKRRLTKSVKYASGYKRRLDSSVRQNILWGIKECNQNSADIIGEQLGADGYEISYHSNPRDTHADMGGRQYAKGKKGVTVKGKYYPPFSEVEGLLKEYGCWHIKFSIFLGISVPAHSEKELREKKQRDKQTFEYEGKKYTGYEATQVQGKLETSMRRERELMQAFRAFGDKDAENEARTRLRHLTSQYASFSKAAGLSTKMERARLAVSGKNSLTAAVNGGIMKESNSLNQYVGKKISKTDNKSVREWYVANVRDIPNKIDKNESLEKQVKQAFELRNSYKHQARVAMSDRKTAEMLEKEKPAKTFEELLESKMKRKNMTKEEALKDILKTASKTNADVNKEFGL